MREGARRGAGLSRGLDEQGLRRRASLLAEDLQTDVPLNTYAGRDDSADAVASFGGLAAEVDLLAEFGSATEALLLLLLYDI